MKNRIISLVVAFCIFVTCVIPVSADNGEYPIKEYYNIEVLHTNGEGVNKRVATDFMVRTDKQGREPVVYVKAEDFGEIMSNAGYGHDYEKTESNYKYCQCIIECAYANSETGHIVRFSLDSRNVAMVYVDGDINYTSPHKILYEDDVVWIPFEFAVEMFYMQAIPENGTIHLTSGKFNPAGAANVAHRKIRELGFDWIREASESEGSMLWNSSKGIAVTYTNKLLSFEPSQWGAVLLANFDTSLADSQMAEEIAKLFITPSSQETQKIEEISILKTYLKTTDVYENVTKIKENAKPDYLSQLRELLKIRPDLAKSKAVKNVQKAITKNENGIKEFADKMFTAVAKEHKMLTKDTGIADSLKMMVDALNVIEYYNTFSGKSERAAQALRIYSDNTKYEGWEKDVFHTYSAKNGEVFNTLMLSTRDKLINGADDFILGGMGAYGAVLQTAGLVWDLVSGIGPIKDFIENADARTSSEYAIRYQDDCLGIYFDYRNECMAEGQKTMSEIEDMVCSLYAYLKFSYIARSSAAYYVNGIPESEQTISVEKLNEKNEEIAEYLVYLEEYFFTPSDAASYDWDDTVYTDTLRLNGTPVERPTQSTVPDFELPEFPGVEGVEYITEEEAIELVKRVVNKFTGGLLEGAFGEIMKAAMETDELYTYKVIGHYTGDKESMSHIVQMYTGETPDAVFFVSVIGNEVWLGTPKDDGDWFVYTDLDLLHAGMGDLVKAIGSLGGQLMTELAKEES